MTTDRSDAKVPPSVTLPDGRRADYMHGVFLPDDGTEEPGTIRARITLAVDGVMQDVDIVLTSEHFEQAYGSGEVGQ